MLRAVIVSIRVNQLVLADPLCDCGECPTDEISQTYVHEHISDLKVGDKMESYTGMLWFRVDDWSTDFDFTKPEDRDAYILKLRNANPEVALQTILEAVFGSEQPECNVPSSSIN